MAVDPVVDILEQETAHAARQVAPMEVNIPAAAPGEEERGGPKGEEVQVAGLGGKIGAGVARRIFGRRKQPLPLRQGGGGPEQTVPGPFKPDDLSAPTPEDILSTAPPSGRGEADPGMVSPHINVDHLAAETPDDIRRMIRKAADEHEPVPVEPHAAITADVDEGNARYLKRILGDEAPVGLMDARERTASVRLLVERHEAVKALMDKINGGDHTPETQLRYQSEWNAFSALSSTIKRNDTETARALSAMRISNEALAVPNLEIMNRTLDGMGGEEYIIRHAQTMSMMGAKADDPLAAAVKMTTQLSPLRMMVEWWKASILSGIETHLVNISSNTIVNLFETLAVRPVAATIGTARSAITGSLDRVTYGEAMEGIAGYRGVRDATAALVETLRTGDPSFKGPTKTEIGEGGTQLSQLGEKVGGKVGKFAADAVTVSFRLLQAEDDFFKTLAFLQEMDRLAIRRGAGLGFKGDRLADFQLQVQRSPESFPEIMAEATRFAERLTFTDRASVPGLVGSVISAARGLVAKHPSLGFVMPFITTPANLVRYATEISGIPVSKRMRDDLAAGGARRDMAVARMTIGLGLTSTVAVQAWDGNITGKGPTDHKQRRVLMETGWRPNAIRVGDQYFTYNRLDPFGQVIGTIADGLDRARYAGDQEKMVEQFMGVGFILADYTLNQTYMRGLNDFMKMVEGRMKPETFIANYASGFVPWSAALADVEQLMDPQVRRPTIDESGPLGAIPGAVTQRIAGRVPGLSADLRPARNWDGTIMLPPKGWTIQAIDALSPVKWSKQGKPDAVTEELIAKGVPVAEPSELFNYAGAEFSITELDEGTGEGGFYDKYIEIVGQSRRKFLSKLIRKSSYKKLSKGPEGEQAMMIRRTLAQALADGRARFWKEHFHKIARANEDNLSPLAQRIQDQGVKAVVKTAIRGDDVEGVRKKRRATEDLPVPMPRF